jgi:hypothetical protein
VIRFVFRNRALYVHVLGREYGPLDAEKMVQEMDQARLASRASGLPRSVEIAYGKVDVA